MTTDFIFNSSSGGIYNVHVHWDEEDVTAMACDCQAGVFGVFCKHLRTLFVSDESLLNDYTQAETFRELSALALRSTPGINYIKLQSDLKEIDREHKELKKRANALKHEFMRHLRG